MARSDEQLVVAAKAILRGPEKKKLTVNNHEFNCKPATIVRDRSGRTVSMAGQLSHCLKLRPDDQIYYTINFTDGQPTSRDVEVDHGGIASIIQTALTAITIDGITVDISGVKIRLNPENLAAAATQISKLVEGRGWENQASAILTNASILATQPLDVVFPTKR